MKIMIMSPEKPDGRKTKRPSGKAPMGTVLIDMDVNKAGGGMFRLKEMMYHDMSKGCDGKGRKKIMIK